MTDRLASASGAGGCGGRDGLAVIDAPVGAALVIGTTGGRVLASAAVVLVLLVLGIGIRRGGPRLRRRADPLLTAGVQTAVLLALTGAATLALVVIWNTAGVRAALSAGPQVGVRVTVTLVLFIAAGLAARFLTRAIDRVAAEHRDAVHGREVAMYLARAGAFAVAGLLSFSVWGIDPGNLLLGAGLLGAVIGLAARQTIGSVIWGFVILASQPFTVGDWVVIGEREGRVSDITTTSTELAAATGDRVVIANHLVADRDVINRSATDRFRVDGEVAIERDADLARAVGAAELALNGVEETLDTPEPAVRVVSADESASTLRLSMWIRDPTPERAARVRSETVVAVTEALARVGITGIGGTGSENDASPSEPNKRPDEGTNR